MGRRRQLISSIVFSGAALILYGLIRFVFNTVGLSVFGAVFLGDVNAVLSALAVPAVVLGSIPAALVAKYSAEYLGRNETERAARFFSLCFYVFLPSAGMFGVAAAFVLHGSRFAALALYLPFFAAYNFLKLTYFTFGQSKLYFGREILSSSLFLLVFALACARGDARVAALSWLAQPVCFTALALWDHRGHLVLRGVRDVARHSEREYGAYMVSSLGNSLPSLASFHLVIVLATWLVPDRAQIGYLSTVIAAMTPLRLLPVALTPVLLPEMARRYGAGDLAGQRRLLEVSVGGLFAPMAVLGGLMIAFPALCLDSLGVAAEPGWVVLWQSVVLSILASVSSSPLGHYLNATKHVHSHAVLSVLGTAGSFLAGVAFLSLAGIAGAGGMFVVGDGTLLIGRILLVRRSLDVELSTTSLSLAAIVCGVFLAMIVGTSAAPWLVLPPSILGTVMALRVVLKVWRAAPFSIPPRGEDRRGEIG